jgi:hypothetical protein
MDLERNPHGYLHSYGKTGSEFTRLLFTRRFFFAGMHLLRYADSCFACYEVISFIFTSIEQAVALTSLPCNTEVPDSNLVRDNSYNDFHFSWFLRQLQGLYLRYTQIFSNSVTHEFPIRQLSLISKGQQQTEYLKTGC